MLGRELRHNFDTSNPLPPIKALLHDAFISQKIVLQYDTEFGYTNPNTLVGRSLHCRTKSPK